MKLHATESGRARGRRRRLAALALAAALSGACACRRQATPKRIDVGDPAPSFDLAAAREGRYRLAELVAVKRAVLLSFVATRSGPAPDDASRAQIVFLKSMARQYAPNGVAVLVADGSAPSSAPEALLNFTYDWQLDDVPVLRDDGGETASRYGIVALPTTFLIGPDGRVRRRWDGFAPAAQLALALESVAGPPGFRKPG